MSRYDAVVVGAGPNGIAAAIRLAERGLGVLLREARAQPGGGAATAEVTLPGFRHDVCASVHPLGIGSPYLRALPLERHGLEWLDPPICLAHPFENGEVAVLERSLEATAASLGPDGDAWVKLFEPFVQRADDLLSDILGPLRWPSAPLLLSRFGLKGLRSTTGLSRSVFRGDRAPALLAGCAAHSLAPLGRPPTAAFGMTLVIAGHAVGWPFARGGSQALIRAMIDYFESLGGTIECSAPVRSMSDLPPSRIVLLDLTPRRVLEIMGDRFSGRYRRVLERYRYGPGVFKVDWALDGPIPWRSEPCRRAGTVHIGGTISEIIAAEGHTWEGRYPPHPFIVLAQPTLFDDTRAPTGQHVAWAYCHVPHGSKRDLRTEIEARIERHAPGFRDLILDRFTMNAREVEERHPNFVGGDIAGGAMTLSQLFTRPSFRLRPYRTSVEGVYLCSCATPPGGGVHGMCGFHAAETALADLR